VRIPKGVEACALGQFQPAEQPATRLRDNSGLGVFRPSDRLAEITRDKPTCDNPSRARLIKATD
jgi:hypothetical protein